MCKGDGNPIEYFMSQKSVVLILNLIAIPLHFFIYLAAKSQLKIEILNEHAVYL